MDKVMPLSLLNLLPGVVAQPGRTGNRWRKNFFSFQFPGILLINDAIAEHVGLENNLSAHQPDAI